MDPHINEWLNIIFRWMHVIAAIAWIGNSFYFMWLDSSIEKPENSADDVVGNLWMVHSGGFYLVEKRKMEPGKMPEVLHWFKWEAGLTWISGFCLLGIVYYMTGGAYLLDPNVSDISLGTGAIIGIGLLIVSWIVYDLLWISPLAKSPKILALISYLLVVFIAYNLAHVFSGRAAFLHVGAMLGTLMAANVWMRIIPAQRQMIGATERGEAPDKTLGERAKMRSVHNNYITFPLLFMMLSNHFPSTFSGPDNWLVLAGMILVGAGIRHYMNIKNAFSLFTLIFALVLAFMIFLYTAPKKTEPVAPVSINESNLKTDIQTSNKIEAVTFNQARNIITQRCTACHSANPTDDVFSVAPNGVKFDSPQEIKQYAERIHQRAVLQKTMPFANKTGMTDQEREILGKWIAQGANVN